MLRENDPIMSIRYVKKVPFKQFQKICFFGHVLEPITITHLSQQSIIDQTKEIIKLYGPGYNYDREATIELSNQAIQLLLEASQLPDKTSQHTITFLQKQLYDVTKVESHNLSFSGPLKGIIREANFLHVARFQAGLQVFNSPHLDMKHKVDFVLANETHCLGVNVKSTRFTTQDLLHTRTPVWKVGVDALNIPTDIGVLYQFPFTKTEHYAFSTKILNQISEGFQTTEATKPLLLPPSDPSQSLDREQCYQLR